MCYLCVRILTGKRFVLCVSIGRQQSHKKQPRALRGCSCVARDTDRLVRDTSYCIGDLVKFSTHEVEDFTVFTVVVRPKDVYCGCGNIARGLVGGAETGMAHRHNRCCRSGRTCNVSRAQMFQSCRHASNRSFCHVLPGCGC